MIGLLWSGFHREKVYWFFLTLVPTISVTPLKPSLSSPLSLCSFSVPLPLWQCALDPSLSQCVPVKVNANNTRDLPELHQESCVHNLSSTWQKVYVKFQQGFSSYLFPKNQVRLGHIAIQITLAWHLMGNKIFPASSPVHHLDEINGLLTNCYEIDTY